jgi:DNA helicase HerA-like ATPase
MTALNQQLSIGARPSGELVVLDPQERRRHLYVVGQTGTGKSTLLLNLIRQDLVAGEGLALLDPHGDLAEAALAHVPRARTNDLVYLNPADLERPIGFNPLSRVPVCTENSVRIDYVTESPNVSGDDRSVRPLPGLVRLAVQVEEPT